MRLNELSQVGQISPSDLLLLWASQNSQTRTAPFSMVLDAVRDYVFQGLKAPEIKTSLGLAASGTNNDITALTAISTSRTATDLNALTATGWYQYAQNGSEAGGLPEGETFLVWHQNGSTTAKAQIAISLTSGDMYSRKLSGTAWSSWISQMQTGDVTVANIPGAGTTGRALMAAANAAAGRSSLGSTTVGDAVFIASSTDAALTALGAGSKGKDLFNAADSAAARLAIMTSFGSSLITNADAAAARSTLGFTATGNALATATSGNAAMDALGGTTVGKSLFTASSSANARVSLGLGGAATQDVGTIAGTVLSGNAPGRFLKATRFTANGTWTPDPLMTSCVVEVQAAGGPGGSVSAAGSMVANTAAGGAAGAFARVRLNAAQAGASQTITLGAPAAPVAGATGPNSPATTFGTIISCPGGIGGQVLNGSSTTLGYAMTPIPAAGAAPTITTGDILASVAGRQAQHGDVHMGVVRGGKGGDAQLGTGGITTMNTAGVAGQGFGAGGSGASANAGSGPFLGGVASGGTVTVWEYS